MLNPLKIRPCSPPYKGQLNFISHIEKFYCNHIIYTHPEHYKDLAPQYDKFYHFQSQARVNFIERHVPLTKDDQLVDIGGGTGQVSLKIRSDLGLTKPVVCVDPSQEMLDVAKKNGAITIKATAEEFFATKPECPLKVVLMNGCIFYFKDIEFVFTKLAEYMPKDGVCIAVEFSSLPLFKGVSEACGGISAMGESFSTTVESSGFNWKMISTKESVDVNKAMWYEGIRNRCNTGLLNFSDKELEQGIEELEEKFGGKDVLRLEVDMNGFILTL